ncbi:hypothetical protein TNCT_243061 [Trichonephila clavata]|uniref:Uncharacterized protein n=1 Tax=Trichonephila clavata TaxID=2740835 RepID=A0A8X6FS72_TRICU|nr:hypothetical protein TNCT_243061 [Trichonephila clavata]
MTLVEAIKGHDKNDACIISSAQTAEMMEFEDKKKVKKLKAKIVHDYNNTMGGVDKVDQQILQTTELKEHKAEMIIKRYFSISQTRNYIIPSLCLIQQQVRKIIGTTEKHKISRIFSYQDQLVLA